MTKDQLYYSSWAVYSLGSMLVYETKTKQNKG